MGNYKTAKVRLAALRGQAEQRIKQNHVQERDEPEDGRGLTVGSKRRRVDTTEGPAQKRVKMVSAIGSSEIFGVLWNVGIALTDKTEKVPDVFSKTPSEIIQAVDAIEHLTRVYGSMRRIGLARMANIFNGLASIKRKGKGPKGRNYAYRHLIATCWEVSISDDTKLSKSGFISNEDPNAEQWNKYKTKLRHQINFGQRWYRIAEKFGWLTLLLIPNSKEHGGENM